MVRVFSNALQSCVQWHRHRVWEQHCIAHGKLWRRRIAECLQLDAPVIRGRKVDGEAVGAVCCRSWRSPLPDRTKRGRSSPSTPGDKNARSCFARTPVADFVDRTVGSGTIPFGSARKRPFCKNPIVKRIGHILEDALEANHGTPKPLVVMHSTLTPADPMQQHHLKRLEAEDVPGIVIG